jgi:hypothetical protein
MTKVYQKYHFDSKVPMFSVVKLYTKCQKFIVNIVNCFQEKSKIMSLTERPQFGTRKNEKVNKRNGRIKTFHDLRFQNVYSEKRVPVDKIEAKRNDAIY